MGVTGMFKLLKKMRKQEILMSICCVLLLLGQIYFDLKMPDYMSELTVFIGTAGVELSSVLKTGLNMLLCALASAVLCIMCGYLTSKIASGFTYVIREDLFEHITGLGQEEMMRFSVPSLITRTTNDITQIQMVIAMGLQTLIKSPVMALWAVEKILGKSRELSLVTAVFVVIICVFITVIVSSVIPRFRIVQRLTDKINKVARENLSGINVVHAFNAEDYQNKKFDETNAKINKTQIKNQHVFAAMQPFMNLSMNSLSLCIFWLGAALISSIPAASQTARLTMFSDVVVFSTYATYVVMSFMMLVMIFMMMPAAEVSAERINQVLETEPKIREGRVEKGKETGTVEFKNVTFRYPDAADDELTDISFKVNKGETLAVIGSTGSGKTTLISMIARFYDAASGQVLVDGVDVRDYSFKGLYDKLGYVTQKAVLFSGSIKDNVAFGQSETEISDEAVERAISLAQAQEFVQKLEGKTLFNIAQGGRNVSGGQKQRISIARALARNAEILIFDDSFSALDYRTDAALRAALAAELADTTKIIVAQRISTIRNADRILVMEDGKIIGNGRHEELMENCSVYREIALSQLSKSELQ